jgi:hypothetical protein
MQRARQVIRPASADKNTVSIDGIEISENLPTGTRI